MKRIFFILLLLIATSLFSQEERFSVAQEKASSPNYVKEFFLIDMREAGLAKAEAVYEYGGVYAQERRAFLEENGYEQQSSFYETQVKRFLGSCERKEWEVQNRFIPEKSLIEKIGVEKVHYAVTQRYDASFVFLEYEIFSLIPYSFIVRGSEKGEPFTENYQFPYESTFELTLKVLTPKGYFFTENPSAHNIQMGALEVEKRFEKKEEGFEIDYRLHWGERPLSPEDALWTAQNLFKFLVKGEPVFIRLAHQGESLFAQSQYTQVLELYEAEVQSPEATFFSFLRLSDLYYGIGLIQKAKEYSDLAVKQFPLSAESWLSRSLFYLEKELGQMSPRFEASLKARNSLEKALFLAPENVEMRELAMRIFLYDEYKVYGRDSKSLKRVVSLLLDLISDSPDYFEKRKESCLYLAYFLRDQKLVDTILSIIKDKKEYEENHAFYLAAFSAYYQGGLPSLFAYLEKVREGEESFAVYSPTLSLAIFFLTFGENEAGIALFDKIQQNPFALEESEKKSIEFYLRWIETYKHVEKQIAHSSIESIEARNDLAGASDWVLRFFYELFHAEPFSYATLEPFFSTSLFQQLRNSQSRFSFDWLFKNLVMTEDSGKGAFEFGLIKYLMNIDFKKTEKLAENLYLVKSSTEGDTELHFLVHWENGSFQIEAIEDFFPALGERIYRNLALNPTLVEGYLTYLDQIAYDEESIKKMSFSGFQVAPYLVMHKAFRQPQASKQWDLTLREKIQGFVVESGFETAEVKELVLADLERLSRGGNAFKNQWATILLCFYYSEQNETLFFREAANRLSEIAKEFAVTSLFHTMALLLDKEEAPVEQFVATLRKQIEERSPQALSEEEFRIIAYTDFSFFLNYDRMVAFLPYWEKLSQKEDLASFYNLIAWASLFGERELSPKDFYYIRKGLELSENRDSAIIHTAATMYAQKGQNDEALKLLKTLDLKKTTFSPSDWYLYGLLMNNFGYETLAQESFERCLKSEQPSFWNEPSSCSVLIKKMRQGEKSNQVDNTDKAD